LAFKDKKSDLALKLNPQLKEQKRFTKEDGIPTIINHMTVKELVDIGYSQIFISGDNQVDMIERQINKKK